MAKWYGSLANRLEENRQFVDTIEVGTGMTEYSYSDREAYEVIAVKDQRHVTVRKYDHKHVGDLYMDNNWELISNPNNPTYDMVKRGKFWYTAQTCTVEDLAAIKAAREVGNFDPSLWFVYNGFDREAIEAKGSQTKYRRWNVSFGKAEYYYDYEF